MSRAWRWLVITCPCSRYLLTRRRRGIRIGRRPGARAILHSERATRWCMHEHEAGSRCPLQSGRRGGQLFRFGSPATGRVGVRDARQPPPENRERVQCHRHRLAVRRAPRRRRAASGLSETAPASAEADALDVVERVTGGAVHLRCARVLHQVWCATPREGLDRPASSGRFDADATCPHAAATAVAVHRTRRRSERPDKSPRADVGRAREVGNAACGEGNSARRAAPVPLTSASPSSAVQRDRRERATASAAPAGRPPASFREEFACPVELGAAVVPGRRTPRRANPALCWN